MTPAASWALILALIAVCVLAGIVKYRSDRKRIRELEARDRVQRARLREQHHVRVVA